MREDDDAGLFGDEPRMADVSDTKSRSLPAKSYPVLPREENRALAARAKEGDRQALERVIHHNMRLVYSVARRYARRGVLLEDLVQEGVIGLMKAVSRFDVSKDVSLSTYATWWIRQAIRKYVISQGSLIRIPTAVQVRISNILQTQEELAEAGVAVNNGSVAERLGITVVQVTKALDALRQREKLVSLDDPLPGFWGDQSLSYGEVTPDTTVLTPHLVWEAKSKVQELVAKITEMMLWVRQRIDERDYQVIILRYGLTTNRIPMTLEAIGEIFGLTRERIRQIVNDAWKRVQKVRHIDQQDFEQWLVQLDELEEFVGVSVDWGLVLSVSIKKEIQDPDKELVKAKRETLQATLKSLVPDVNYRAFCALYGLGQNRQTMEQVAQELRLAHGRLRAIIQDAWERLGEVHKRFGKDQCASWIVPESE